MSEKLTSSTKGLHCLRNSQARMTTEVVPSPTSASWLLAMSTRVLAAGCTMSSSFMMVAPSFEMVAEPLASTISLSIPRGPRVVRTASDMVCKDTWIQM